VWVDVKFTNFSDGRRNTNVDGHFGLATIGADYVLNRSLLIGTMVQFDSASERSELQASAASGWGWMVGPYSTVRLGENLFWQARAAWGKSTNDVSPFLTYSDQFDTMRWLAASVLIGRWRVGPWEFTPSASVAYMVDTANDYVDTLGAVVPEVKSRLGQAKAGPEIGYAYSLGDIKMEPHAGFQLIWNFATDTTANGVGSINGESAGPPGVRGRLDLGVRATAVGGVGVDLSGSYDGVGSRGYDAVTGKVLLRVPLN
jgi:outer membrane autotransporter protein